LVKKYDKINNPWISELRPGNIYTGKGLRIKALLIKPNRKSKKKIMKKVP